jgi:membrane associated rhomboid family serine protease
LDDAREGSECQPSGSADDAECCYASYTMPPVTQAIIGANVVVFLLQSSLGDSITLWFALWPLSASAAFGPEVGFAPWQLVTYGFLHGGFAHIFFNMFAVYTFGSTLEQFLGSRSYALLYFVSVVTAGLTQLGFNELLNSPYPTVGASGGVFGLLLAFGMYFPRQRIMLLFPPIPMPAWVAVTAFGALELFLGVTGTQAGVAHFAHLGGMLGAFLLIQHRRGKPPFAKRRR